MRNLKDSSKLDEPGWLAVDPYVQAFETAFCRSSDVDITDFLPPKTSEIRSAVIAELMRVEMELCQKSGKPKRLKDYRRSFPEIFSRTELTACVAFEEYRLRLAAGEHPVAEEYQKQYGVDVRAWPRQLGKSNEMRSVARITQGLSVAEVAQSDDWPRPGIAFLGFQLTEELGRGAFGRVYLAQQKDLAGRLVALKVSSEAINETQSLAQLQHAAIVPIYSLHRQGRFVAFVMPYCGATTLADVLRHWRNIGVRPGSGRELRDTIRKLSTVGDGQGLRPQTEDRSDSEPVTTQNHSLGQPKCASPWQALEPLAFADSALWLVAKLAAGLEHAHDRGIVHRDLKPENILLGNDGQPMLLDFNLATDLKRRFDCCHEVVGGTLPYMSPEQLISLLGGRDQPDPRSDIYSLGVILHELLLGVLPHSAAESGDWRTTAHHWLELRETVPAGLNRPKLPLSAAVAAILRRCLAADPKLRYQTAGELREDLECQLASLPLRHAPDRSLLERFGKWRRRHPRLASVGGLTLGGVVLLVVAVILGTAMRERLRFLEAESLYGRSESDLQTAFFSLHGVRAQPSRDQIADAACRRLASDYGFLERKDWRRSAAIAYLPVDRRSELTSRLGQTLLLWQRATVRQANLAPSPKERKALLEKSLRLSHAAESCFDPDSTPEVLLRWRSSIETTLNRGGTVELSAKPSLALSTDVQTGDPNFIAFLAALDHLDANRLQDAASVLRRITRAAPRHPAAWPVLGQCEYQLGRFREAESAFSTCISLWPNTVWPYMDRGLALKELGAFAEAEEDFTTVISSWPDCLDAYVNRAIVRMESQSWDSARADLEVALQIAPRSARLHMLRAQWYQKTGDVAAQSRETAIANSLPPDDEVCWVVRGVQRIADGDAKGALADFDAAVALNPWLSMARQNKAHVLSEMLGRTDDAIHELTQVVESNPGFAAAWRGRGVLYARQGRRQEALADARRALALDAQVESLYQIGGIYALFSKKVPEDRDEALRLLSLALQQGYGLNLVDHDPELDSMRDDEDFKKLIAIARKHAALTTPP